MGNMQRQIYKSPKLQRISIPLRIINSPQRQAVIKEAITWVGTPFHHQGRSKDIGCDCIGLDIGIARKFGFDKIVGFEDYKAYSKNPDGHTMTKLLTKYHNKILLNDILPGDWLHFSFIQFPQHVAMLMPDAHIIHAHEPDKKVIYHRLNEWWINRIAGVYRYRGLS